VWSIDRLNARKPNQLTNACRSTVAGLHSTAETAALLTHIDRNKQMTTSLVSIAIDGSWIGYANAMRLKFQEPNTPGYKQIVTISDLHGALSSYNLWDRLAALYFLPGYTHDVLYLQVFWEATHQDTVEAELCDENDGCLT
jgi:hypothetical protein